MKFGKKIKNKSLKKQTAISIGLSSIFLFNSILPVYAINNSSIRSNIYSKSSQVKVSESKKSNKRYTLRELNQMNSYDLIDLLVKTHYRDITDLFNYSHDAYEFFRNKNRTQMILREIEKRGREYTENDAKGIPTLIEVVRAGYFLAFHNEELKKEIYDRNNRLNAIPAILSIENNKNFKLGTEVQDDIVAGVGSFIWNTASNTEVINNLTPIVKDFYKNRQTYCGKYGKDNAIHAILGGPCYDIEMYLRDTKKRPEETEWYGRINPFIEEVQKLALMGNLNDKNSLAIENSLYHISLLGKFHTNSKLGIQALTKSMDVYPYLSMPYLQAVDKVKRNYNGIDANGKKIDFDKVKQAGRKKYCPKTYTFDNGKMIIKAGDKVEEDKIKRLYWASKEVNAHFFRAMGIDKPLEKGNPDEVLTMVIYNSPKEYNANNVLYGYATDNGGMYIEQTGTFFTFERKSHESIYTLEELFRHEYTHYLQGRYAIPGMWGATELYKNSRLTWYEEGGAELFAGSTRTDGVLPRKTIISHLHNVDKNHRYTVNDVLNSVYGNFEFYNYACVFIDLLHRKKNDKFYELNQYIKNNDVRGYDNFINNLKSDSNLNRCYQEYMQELIDKYDTLTVPLVSNDYLIRHAYKDPKEIYSDISAIANLKDIKTEVNKSEYFDTFTLRGKFKGKISKGKTQDFKDMNEIANEFLKKLDKKSWTGYKTVTCYFTNYKVDSNNRVTYDLVFHGYLPREGDSQNALPYAKINGPYIGIQTDNIRFSSEGSQDVDGKIVKYEWDFGDGSKSSEANPRHIYKEVGEYTIKLKVTDDKGESSTAVSTVTVKDISENNLPIVKIGGPYQGFNNQKIGFYSNGTRDEDGEIKSYEWNFGDGSKSNEANPIHVYKEPGNYTVTLKVTDNLGGQSVATTKAKILKMVYPINREKEPNNSIELANGPILPGVAVQANLDAEDPQDYFYFDVFTPGEVNIKLTRGSGAGATWIVFDENRNEVAYGVDDGREIKGSFNANKEGRYYISVYTFDGNKLPYKLEVSGSVGR
ncbi:collagenase [Clostridiaceae bacterium 14S0207]|nr:collagenase [Clostridiaceae bacterium 14S0207]